MCVYVVKSVEADSADLDAIARLWKENKDTLGFFPEVALRDYAARDGILAIMTPSGDLQGYVMYYAASAGGLRIARIVHLCVASACRGRGFARALLAELRRRTRFFSGASVRCRRDFPAHSLWPTLGFHVAAEGVGRAGLPVTDWWLDYGNPDLFTAAPPDRPEVVVAVLDACVFFDLQPGALPENPESVALLADWIPQDVELVVTHELRNEIDRNGDVSARRAGRTAMQEFREIRVGIVGVEVAERDLRPLFPAALSASDASDLRELAHAVAAGASVFLTYDPRLLALDEEVYAAHGLSILRPFEFITRLDESRREHEYSPARVLGSRLAARRPLAGEVDFLVGAFQQDGLGERKRRLHQRLAGLLSMAGAAEVTIVLDGTTPLMLSAERADQHRTLSVPLMRVAAGRWETTLAEFAATHLILRAVSLGCQVVCVQDEYLRPSVISALAQLGYVETGVSWDRVVLQTIAEPQALVRDLLERAAGRDRLQTHLAELGECLLHAAAANDMAMVCEIERTIWPAKTAGTGVPAVIVPIRPDWAAELFDYGIGERRLLHADPSLMLRSENAYYSAAPAACVTAPSRVLWYVSHDTRVSASKSIRAASVITEVLSAPPKVAYRKYRHLGVYSWADVSAMGGRSGRVTALHFGLTEVLPYPIGWDIVQEELQRMENRRSQLQCPTQIAPRTFDAIYARGLGLSTP